LNTLLYVIRPLTFQPFSLKKLQIIECHILLQMDQTSKTEIRPFKVILVGDSSVGKTCLLHHFSKVPFNGSPPATIGSSGTSTSVTIDGEVIHLNICDTAGSEAYQALVPFYARSAVVAVVVASAVDVSSIEKIDVWIEFAKQGGGNPAIIVVINKQDLIVDEDHFRGVWKELELKYEHLMLTSAKTGHNVKEVFQMAAEFAKERGMIEIPTTLQLRKHRKCC
jgi:small GTP-binding protein